MKLNKIFGGMICLALLASCGDEMDYHEYTNYDKDYVFTNFDNTVGFITNIYGKMADGFAPYGKGMLASACDEAEYSWKNGSVQNFTNGAWSALNAMDSWSNNYTSSIKIMRLRWHVSSDCSMRLAIFVLISTSQL